MEKKDEPTKTRTVESQKARGPSTWEFQNEGLIDINRAFAGSRNGVGRVSKKGRSNMTTVNVRTRVKIRGQNRWVIGTSAGANAKKMGEKISICQRGGGGDNRAAQNHVVNQGQAAETSYGGFRERKLDLTYKTSEW